MLLLILKYSQTEQKFNEYIMLALRSKGIDLNELRNNFDSNWIDKNYSYIKKLSSKNLLNISKDFISLTKNGYAVCDEIVKNLVM